VCVCSVVSRTCGTLCSVFGLTLVLRRRLASTLERYKLLRNHCRTRVPPLLSMAANPNLIPFHAHTSTTQPLSAVCVDPHSAYLSRFRAQLHTPCVFPSMASLIGICTETSLNRAGCRAGRAGRPWNGHQRFSSQRPL